MAKKQKTYLVDGNPVDVSIEDSESFLKAYPNAKEAESFLIKSIYDVSGPEIVDTVDVELNDIAAFKKAYPDAKPLYDNASASEKELTSGVSRSGDTKTEKKKTQQSTGKVGAMDGFSMFSQAKSLFGDIVDYFTGDDEKPAAGEKKDWTAGVSRIGPKAEKEQAPKQVTPKPDVDLTNVIERQQQLAAKKMSPDEYAEQVKKESDDAYVAYQKKVRDESADFYLANVDKYGDKFGGLYLEYLKEKSPDRFNQIQKQIASGDWDKGADPEKKAKLEQLGKAINSPFLGQAYEIYAEIVGEKNLENTAQLYKEAINWKSTAERNAYDRITSSPVMKQAQQLQRRQQQLMQMSLDEGKTLPASMMASANEAASKLSETPDVKEYAALAEKGAANGNKLAGADWDRYQQLQQSPNVQNYNKAIQEYENGKNTPVGREFEKINQQMQALQQTPAFKQALNALQIVDKNSADTKAQAEAWAKKFPKQAYAEAFKKSEQQKVDAYYKRMNPVLKAMADMGTTLMRVPAAIGGEMAAGVTRAAGGAGELLGGGETESGTAIISELDNAANLIASVAEGLNNNLFPQPTNLQVAAYDNYAPYNGFRVYTNKRNEVIDIRDADGYSVPEDVSAGVMNAWQLEPKKPAKVNSLNKHMILPRIVQTAADLIVLSQVPVAGGAVGLGHKASMMTYGYLSNYNTAYEEIKAADPFISESGAHLYANAKGMMMGGLLTVTPQSLFPGKDGNVIWKEIGQEYTKILAGGSILTDISKKGITAKWALGKAMSKVIGKEGLAMAGIGFGMDLSDRALKLATNTITDRPTQETEYTFNQAVETGLSMFVVGAIMAGANKGFKGLQGDALYTGLKNYERTIGELEQMANAGKISQQDFTRVSGILSQLKPIYDNLADMGKYNDAYKSQLIGLYAQKLQVEEKIGRTSAIEALQKGPSPERDVLTRQLQDIDSKIEQLAIVNNPDYVVYTKAAEIGLDPRTKEIVDRYKKGQGITQEELDYLNSRVVTGKQYVIDPASGKVMAIKEGVKTDTDLAKDVFLGVRVELPKYGIYEEGQASKRVTRDELLEMLKDPEFLADFVAGRKGLEIFNDIEMEALVQRYVQPKQPKQPTQEPQAQEPAKLTGRPKLLGVGGATVASSMGEPVKPVKGGPEGKIESTETGVYFTDNTGKSVQLPVADKLNPVETLSELGYELVAPAELPPPVPKTEVQLMPDNVSFSVGGEQLTWLKFNYGNNGELQTADMVRQDGTKVKIKDRDVVYDMAVQLSNNSRTRLAVPNERASADITEAVTPIKTGFDQGMRAIDTIFGDVDPVVESVLESIEMEMEVDADEHAAAELWLEDAIRRTEKIDTQNAEEKARVIEWAKGLLGEIGTAKVAAKRPVQPEPVAEGAGGQPVVEGQPSAPAKQRVYEFPEIPSRAKALVKRLAGAKGEAEGERIISTIKQAYEAEQEPKAELAKIGYAKQEYEKAITEVVEALKPTVREVEVAPAKAEFMPSKTELENLIEDGTAMQLVQSGQVTPLEFMRQVDKAELPLPTWFSKMEEGTAEEQGYMTEAEESELLDLINKATERTGVPEMKEPVAVEEAPKPAELPEPVKVEQEGQVEYKYTTEQTKLANEIKELKTILNAGTFNGKKLTEKEKGFYDTRIKQLETKLEESLAETKPVAETKPAEGGQPSEMTKADELYNMIVWQEIDPKIAYMQLGLSPSDPEIIDTVLEMVKSGKLPSKKWPSELELDLTSSENAKKIVEIVQNAPAIPTKATKVKRDATPLKKIESLKGIVGTDITRPSLMGVYFDGDNGKLVATDAHKLIIIPDPLVQGTLNRLINPKNGEKIEDRAPNYYAVIPESSEYNITVNLDDLIAQVNGLKKTSNFFDKKYNEETKSITEVRARIEYGDKLEKSISFNPSVALPLLKAMSAFGVTKVNIGINNPSSAIMFDGDNGVTGLLMPVSLTGEIDINQISKPIIKNNGTAGNTIYTARDRASLPGKVREAFKGYKRGGGGGPIRYSSNAPRTNEAKVGQSQGGEIDRAKLKDFVDYKGVNDDGTIVRGLASGWGDIVYALNQMPGNIEMYRDMAKGNRAITQNVFRFKINGVPFNPKTYLRTGRIEGKVSEDIAGPFKREAQEAGDVGFTPQEIIYRQEQFNFEDNPNTRKIEIKDEQPLMWRSSLEIQEQSIESTGKDLTKALAESKMRRKLEKGEYVTKTSKVSLDKSWKVGSSRAVIKSPADVAYIMRGMEDLNKEHTAITMIDANGNKVVAHISVGKITSADVDYNGIFDMLNAFGAKEFYFIHNHPSGLMKPSEDDIIITRAIQGIAQKSGAEFKGSVIVDWDKSVYSYIDNEGNVGPVGASYFDRPDTGAYEEIPMYNNWTDSLNESVPDVKFQSEEAYKMYASSMVSQMRAGQAAKGGVILVNNNYRVVGHFFLNGNTDVETITKAVATTNAAGIITYGTFDTPVIELDQNVLDAQVLDHVQVHSQNFAKYDIGRGPVEPVFPDSAVNIPRVRELSMPFNDKSSKLEQSVQKAMTDGFVTFDEVMLNLYTDFYAGDAAKIRQNLQKIKDAYDEVSLLDEFIDSAISSIDEVARFDLDRFLINVNRPQKKENSLRQQYNDFASWFEHNYPQYKFYYSIDIDPGTGQVYFRIGKEPVKMTNGNVLYYGDWLGNKKWQKDWVETQKSEVFDRPPMVWVDKEITPVPYQHVAPNQYDIGADQEFAVNMILDRFMPKTPGKKPKRGFMLGDGMGIGKTRIALASANELIKAKGLPVLIITKGDNVVEQFQREAAALSLSNVLYKSDPKNVNDSKIVIGTYEDLKRGKVGNADSYAAIVFDEAHMLKNKGTQRSMSAEEFLKKAEHVVFATGTPMDKPVQLLYFIQHLSGVDAETTLKEIGLEIVDGALKVRRDSKVKNFKQLFLNWRETMIREGGYLRREYPFYGTAGKVYIDLPESAVGMLEIIKKNNGRSGIMAANRYQEHLKIPYIYSETLKALEEGKQVVIFCVGVNDTKIYPEGKKPKDKMTEAYFIEVPQFAREFSRRLKDAGIPHANIFGPDAAGKLEESRRFQRGEAKVAIATIASGGTGIDLDDQFGDAPREVIFATLPWSGNEFDQAQFRVSRRNTKTPSRMRFLFAGNSWADEHKEGLVNKKMETLRLIQAGKDPDIIDMENWREDANGGLIDIVEDDFNELDENVSAPEPNQYVQAFPEPTIETVTETPSDVKEKFESGDKETLQAVGMLPQPKGQDVEFVKVTPENQAEPETDGKVEPTTPLGSTKGQPTTIGGAKTKPTPQRRRARWKSILFGPPKQKSLSTMVLEIFQELGIPTKGDYHMSPKYLGYYSHVTKDVTLKVSSDIFVAIHEAIHWADFSSLNGVTYKIIQSGNQPLIKELQEIHDKFYPGAKKTAPLSTKVAEGMTMYMQMKLYDPDIVLPYKLVAKEIFSPGGKYYGKIWDDIFDKFENLKNEIDAMSPIMQAGLRMADMNTPKSSDYTIGTWNALAKKMFKYYDESTPLALYDEQAGVGFGTAMERMEGGRLIQSVQNAYFFYRDRNRLASSWIATDPSFVSGLLPSTPMYYNTNGQWTAGKYRMEDIINNLANIQKSNPNLLVDDVWKRTRVYTEDVPDITGIYSGYLIMRRVFMDYQKRKDYETQIQTIIANGMQFYQDIINETDPDIHEAMVADFNTKYVRPLRVAFERWKRVNDIIGNEGGSYVQLNSDFSPDMLAWSSPAFRNLHSSIYNPNLGNIVTDANATEVYQKYNQVFKEADKIFDNINQTMLTMMVSTGMLSPARANEYKLDNTKYPGYASFQRQISNTFFNDPELERIVGSDNVSKINSTKERKGSTANIIDPVLSQAIMIHEVFRKGLKNLMWLRLANLTRIDEQLARGFMPIPTIHVPVPGKKGEILYMKPVIQGEIDIPGSVLVYANGTGKYYQIADEGLLAFYNAFTDLDGGKIISGIVNSRIYKAGVGAATMFTLMTTGVYPYWAIQNLTVDQLSAWLNSRLGTIPFYTSAKNFIPSFGLAVGNMLGLQLQSFSIFQQMFPGQKPVPRQLQYITDFMSMGGSNQTMIAQLLTDEQKATVKELFEVEPKGVLPKLKFALTKKLPKVITWTVDFASLPTNISEIITRSSEFIEAQKRGYSLEASTRYAIETMPFKKRGASKTARWYFPLVSYMRSSFTVAGKTLEEFKNQPTKFATVWASLVASGALAFINFWEELTEGEKNIYLQADGTELSQYFIIPARFMGGPENTMYRFRVAEFLGSANAIGMLYGMSVVTSKPVEYKQMAKAAASNFPSLVNPYEWTFGDNTPASSAYRQVVRNFPQLGRPVWGLYSDKTTTGSGTRPITPRSLEYYPQEFQYRIGPKGTSTVAKDISDAFTGKLGLSPIQTEYLITEFTGRTGRSVLDYIDEKEVKSAFVKSRKDYGLRGRWYEEFYRQQGENRDKFTVLSTLRDPKPASGTPESKEYKDRVMNTAKEYALTEHMGELLSTAYKVRDFGVANDKDLPLYVYDKFDEAIKSFNDKESYNDRKDKMDEAYKFLKQASREVGYKDIQFFSTPKYSAELKGQNITKEMNKLFKR